MILLRLCSRKRPKVSSYGKSWHLTYLLFGTFLREVARSSHSKNSLTNSQTKPDWKFNHWFNELSQKLTAHWRGALSQKNDFKSVGWLHFCCDFVSFWNYSHIMNRSGTTWGLVTDEITLIYGWSFPLMLLLYLLSSTFCLCCLDSIH